MAPKLASFFWCGITGLAAAAGNHIEEWVGGNASAAAVAGDALLGASASAPSTYSTEEAITTAYLATAAYCDDVDQWSCGLPCLSTPGVTSVRRMAAPQVGAYGFVGRLNGQCIAAFRGTSDAAGLTQDLLDFDQLPMPGCSYQGRTCMVAIGFLHQWQALSPIMKSKLASIGCTPKDPLLITGHSMGGAVATLAQVDLLRAGWQVSKVYTFGSTRVGNAAFVGAFQQALQAQSGRSVHFRFALASDPYIYMPPAGKFVHVDPEVFFPKAFDLASTFCVNACSRQVDSATLNTLLSQCADPQTCSHYMYMEPAKRGPMSGASCGAPLSTFQQQTMLP